MNGSRDEADRRELAQRNKGEVIAESGKPLEASSLEQMISVRLNADTLAQLRRISRQRNMSLSALIMEALGTYVDNEGFTSDIHWRIIRYEGVVSSTTDWTEKPRSRSSLRDMKDSAATS